MKNKIIRNILIILGVLALIGCIIFIVMLVMAGNVVDETVDDAKLSAAKTDAMMVVTNVNNYCTLASATEQISGKTNPCKDGVTVEEANAMIEDLNCEVLDITYENDKVTYLKIKSNKITIEYNGTTYEMVK